MEQQRLGTTGLQSCSALGFTVWCSPPHLLVSFDQGSLLHHFLGKMGTFDWSTGHPRLLLILPKNVSAACQLIWQWRKQCWKRQWRGRRRWRGHSSSESWLGKWNGLRFWKWRPRKRRRNEEKTTCSKGNYADMTNSCDQNITVLLVWNKTFSITVKDTKGFTWQWKQELAKKTAYYQ